MSPGMAFMCVHVRIYVHAHFLNTLQEVGTQYEALNLTPQSLDLLREPLDAPDSRS